MKTRVETSVAAGREEPRMAKPYRPPELTEWGTVTELTLGPKGGTEDFPSGGTRGV